MSTSPNAPDAEAGESPRWLLGNDVVDLYDPDSRGILDNHAFLDRVFVAAEREVLAREREVDMAARLAWSLWAGKEAAYKALIVVRPDLVWSPRRFIVSLDDSFDFAVPGARLRGRVGHESGATLDFNCDLGSGPYVHAVCLARREQAEESRAIVYRKPAPALPPGRLVAAVADMDRTADESDAVRELALRLWRERAASARAPAVDSIQGAVPRFESADGPLQTPLSLSHHGAFIACAFLLPRSP